MSKLKLEKSKKTWDNLNLIGKGFYFIIGIIFSLFIYIVASIFYAFDKIEKLIKRIKK